MNGPQLTENVIKTPVIVPYLHLLVHNPDNSTKIPMIKDLIIDDGVSVIDTYFYLDGTWISESNGKF